VFCFSDETIGKVFWTQGINFFHNIVFLFMISFMIFSERQTNLRQDKLIKKGFEFGNSTTTQQQNNSMAQTTWLGRFFLFSDKRRYTLYCSSVSDSEGCY
jgi:hypothetical protein